MSDQNKSSDSDEDKLCDSSPRNLDITDETDHVKSDAAPNLSQDITAEDSNTSKSVKEITVEQQESIAHVPQPINFQGLIPVSPRPSDEPCLSTESPSHVGHRQERIPCTIRKRSISLVEEDTNADAPPLSKRISLGPDDIQIFKTKFDENEKSRTFSTSSDNANETEICESDAASRSLQNIFNQGIRQEKISHTTRKREFPFSHEDSDSNIPIKRIAQCRDDTSGTETLLNVTSATETSSLGPTINIIQSEFLQLDIKDSSASNISGEVQSGVRDPRNKPPSLLDSGVEATSFPEVEPTSLPDTEVEPTSLPDTEVEPTSLPDTKVEPTSLPDTEVEPTSSSDTGFEPPSLPDTEDELSSLPDPGVEPSTLSDPGVEPTGFPDPAVEPPSFPDPAVEPPSFPDPGVWISNVPDPGVGPSNFPDSPPSYPDSPSSLLVTEDGSSSWPDTHNELSSLIDSDDGPYGLYNVSEDEPSR